GLPGRPRRATPPRSIHRRPRRRTVRPRGRASDGSRRCVRRDPATFPPGCLPEAGILPRGPGAARTPHGEPSAPPTLVMVARGTFLVHADATMKPAPFDYVAPTTLAEAVGALADHGDDAKVLAGGQSLVPMMNFRLAAPAVLV